MKPTPFRGNISTVDDGYWTHFLRRGSMPKGYRELRDTLRVTGKYLFFSEERDKLVDLAVEELENHGFREAKVKNEGTKVGSEYVLCLYYRDDTRRHELAGRYRTASGIKYRYWKSDSDTIAGKYSEQFLKGLNSQGEPFGSA